MSKQIHFCFITDNLAGRQLLQNKLDGNSEHVFQFQKLLFYVLNFKTNNYLMHLWRLKKKVPLGASDKKYTWFSQCTNIHGR